MVSQQHQLLPYSDIAAAVSVAGGSTISSNRDLLLSASQSLPISSSLMYPQSTHSTTGTIYSQIIQPTTSSSFNPDTTSLPEAYIPDDEKVITLKILVNVIFQLRFALASGLVFIIGSYDYSLL